MTRANTDRWTQHTVEHAGRLIDTGDDPRMVELDALIALGTPRARRGSLRAGVLAKNAERMRAKYLSLDGKRLSGAALQVWARRHLDRQDVGESVNSTRNTGRKRRPA